MVSELDQVRFQREYYARTAVRYDHLHVDPDEQDEHYFALMFMVAAMEFFGIKSVLDVGSGTGRVVEYIKMKAPEVNVVGVEPVEQLRQVGYDKGLGKGDLVGGDATSLQFSDGQFDLVCEFGVLHHIKRHQLAVAEMLRVSKKAIFLSDANNFGQGSFLGRSIKQLINAFGLWSVADFIKTRGKGYTISEGDGLAYSYSVFNNYKQIEKQCGNIHLLNTRDGQINSYRTASHVALLGIK